MARTVLLMLALALSGGTFAGERPMATVYKSPTCGCCGYYVEYLRDAGFPVEVVDTDQLSEIKRQHGVPARYGGCHTTVVDGYVVEGHVPLTVLERLLSERPAITGITLPGMPNGSPGMSGVKRGPFEVYRFTDGDPAIELYAVE